MIGQCGLTIQDCAGEEVLEVGYLLRKEYWHQGYATEAAKGCVEYAFTTLFVPAVYALVRDKMCIRDRQILRWVPRLNILWCWPRGCAW